MSVPAFAALLERLVFTPGRNAKIALLRRWFETQPDPERGLGLAALTDELGFTAAKPSLVSSMITERQARPLIPKITRTFSEKGDVS